MMRYALRKRQHKWLVYADERALLEFDGFEEAFMVAWTAAAILDDARAASFAVAPAGHSEVAQAGCH